MNDIDMISIKFTAEELALIADTIDWARSNDEWKEEVCSIEDDSSVRDIVNRIDSKLGIHK
jgi:hypothetical protein